VCVKRQLNQAVHVSPRAASITLNAGNESMKRFDVRHRAISGLAVCFTIGVGVMTMAQHSGSGLEGGANVLAAAQAAGVRRYLRQSIGFWAAPGLGLADEGTPLAFDASPAVAADARIVTELENRLLGTQNIEGIALRYGFFYGPGTWFNPDGDVARQVRQQQFPIVGNGEGVWSWLHIEDAAIATVAAAERGNPGIYLIANDQPLAVREWLPAFARWLNAPPPPQISVEDVLTTNGADAVYYGTQMRGVSNAKAKCELTFQPRPLEWVVDTAPAHAQLTS
jgi:nucleoside-diphosphate-sugar epimerase